MHAPGACPALEVCALPARSVAAALYGLRHLHSVRLVDWCLDATPMLPHLRRLAVQVGTPQAAQQLAAAVPHLTSITRLVVRDVIEAEDDAGLVQLPGLRELGGLRELVCVGSTLPQAWYCTQLTALTLL